MNVLKKKRNLLITLCIAAMLICAAALFGAAALPNAKNTAYAAGYFEPKLAYTFSGGEYTVTGVDFNHSDWKNMTDEQKINIKIAIPATYNDGVNGECSVTAIADKAFIKDLAAFNDTKITSLDFSAATNLKTIGNEAFIRWSTSLTSELTIPDSVTSIGKSAFFNCSGLTGALTIPSSVESIGEKTFSMCSKFTSLAFEENSKLATIGNYAFGYCGALTGALNIPNSVTTIGNNAFENCKLITSLQLPKNAGFNSIGEYAFKTCEKLTGALIIPDSVTTIGNSAFRDCAGITSLKLPENAGFNAIGEYAFGYCSALTGALIIPDSVTSIGQRAFAGATLKTCYLPENATFGSYCLNSAQIIVAKNKAQYDSCNAAFTADNRYALVTYETTVTFDANDGGNIGGAQQVTQTKLFGGSFSAEKNAETNIWIRNSNTYDFPTATKLGYIWESYNTLKDGTGTELQYTEHVADAPTYYAQYKENPFTYFEITNVPTKTTYTALTNFDPAGMKLTANFKDGSTQEVTEYTVLNGDNLQAGTSTVTVSVTIGGKTLTKNIGITVNKIQLTKPTVSGAYVYIGQEQTVTLNGFNADTMNVTGNKGTSAKSYTATVNFNDEKNYMWDDGGIYPLEFKWTIDKATPSITPSYDTNTKVYVGGKLPQITSNQDSLGSIAWDAHTLTAAETGKLFGWTWTPTDTANYNSVKGNITFNVLAVELESISVKFNQGDTKVFTSTDVNSFKNLFVDTLIVTKHFNNGTAEVISSSLYNLSGDLSQAGPATITVMFNGKTATFEVEVTAVKLESISATFTQIGIKIYTSNTLDSLKQHLGVIGTNNDGTPYYGIEYTLSGTLTAGTSTITVTAKDTGMTATFDVTVTAVELVSISATFNQGETKIYTSSALDSLKNMLTVTGLNNDGTAYSETIDYTLSGMLSAGTSTITAAFNGKTATFNVTVTAVALESISATFNQNGAKIYTSATLDSLKSYLTVTGLNNDGMAYSETIDYALSGTLTEGTSTITATFNGKTATFNVTVTAVALESISATFNQNGAKIYTSATLDSLKSYLTVTGLNNDGMAYSETIDYALSGTLVAGNSTITATFNGKTATFNVTVTAVALESISVTFTQNGTKIYTSGALESLKNMLTVTGLNNDGTAYSETIDYTLTGTLTEGTSTITATFNGKTATFVVTVTAVALENIKVTAQPTDTTYTAFENFNENGMVITATFNDGTTQTVTNYTIADGTNLQAGTTSLTISYTVDGVTKKAAVSITVNKIQLEKPSVSGAYTYNGKTQTITLNGFDENLMTIEGNTGKNAEKYQATVSLSDKTNYSWADGSTDGSSGDVTLDFIIAKANLTVTAKDHSIFHGEAPSADGVTYAGFVNGEGESAISGALVFSYNYSQYGDVGEYTITPSGLAAINYEIDYVFGKLTVKELLKTVYLGGSNGNDSHGGTSAADAVLDVNTAIKMVADGGTIVVCGDTAAPKYVTKVENKSITFTNTDGKDSYANAVLRTYSPTFWSNVTIRNVFWKDVCVSYPEKKQCEVGENVTLTLDNVTCDWLNPATGESIDDEKNYIRFIYAKGPGARLIIRNSDFSGRVSYLCNFKTVTLDNSVATALYTKSFPSDAGNFILKNGSTLSVSMDINTLTSIGAGNIVEVRKAKDQNTPLPVTVIGEIVIDNGNPITLTSYFKPNLKDKEPFLYSTHSTFSTDKFALSSAHNVNFALYKENDTIYAMARTVSEIVVTPSESKLQRGQTLQFSAVVNGDFDPSQKVTWSVSGGKSGTSISASGLLTVASDEAFTALTVTAVSALDKTKSVSVTVEVVKRNLSEAAIGDVESSFTYTGLAHTPPISISDNGNIAESDYVITYSHNTNAGTATITIAATESGNYTGEVTKTFTINKATPIINTDNVNLNYTYTGALQTVSGGAAVGNSEQTVSYENNTFTTVFEGNGKVITISVAETKNYLANSVTVILNVQKANYDMSGITFSNAAAEYDGQSHSPAVSGALPIGADGIALTVSYFGSATTVADGAVNVTATFATTSANYNIPAAMTATMTITPKVVALNWAEIADLIYSGEAKTTTAAALGLIGGDECFVTVSLTNGKNNVNVGKFTYTATGLSNGNYKLPSNVTSGEYTVTAKEIVIDWCADDFTYNGHGQSSSVTASYQDVNNQKITLALTSGEFKNYSANGVEFSVSFANNETNYKLPTAVAKTYNIKKLAVSVKANDSEMTYGDNVPLLTWSYNGANQFIAWDNIILIVTTNAASTSAAGGAYHTQITELVNDNYSVTYTDGAMTVNKREITVTIDNAASVYGNTLSDLTASVTRGSIVNGDAEVFALATTATQTSNVGNNYTITGTAKNANYNITFVSAAYTVTARTLTEDMVAELAAVVYNGQAQEPEVSVKDGDLLKAADYYLAFSANTNAGEATVTINAKGNYIGAVTRMFIIQKAEPDMSGISFEDKTVVYNGTSFGIEIAGKLPSGITVTYTENKTAAGIYTMTATFLGDNYILPPAMTATLTIRYDKQEQPGDSGGSGTVIVESPEGIDPNYKLDAKDVTENYTPEIKVETFIGKKQEIKQVYDVKLLDSNSVAMQPDGMLTIRLLLAENYRNLTDIKVYLMNGKTMTELTATRDGNYMVFSTAQLAEYAIVGEIVNDGLSSGAITVIVIVSIHAFLILLLLMLFLLRKDKTQGLKAYYAGWFKKGGRIAAENKISGHTDEATDENRHESCAPDADLNGSESDAPETGTDNAK